MDDDFSGGLSECSSGCESGWTVYFDEVSNSDNFQQHKLGFSSMDGYCHQINLQENYDQEDEDEEDEDLSMVSDASSPHFQNQEYGCDYNNYYYYNCNYHYNHVSSDDVIRKPKKKISCSDEKINQKKKNNLSFDDIETHDTATSPFFHFSKGNVGNNDNQDYGFSHFEEESIPKKHLGFYKSSKKGKSGSFLGRKRL
ncbi:protein SOB FIVE-LIKE 5-like [Andrographis paniculata]|uniref:protein SOB FIVE-LIKE 5-like n=1 Tax=Andrographis paniculata TaxID=175694 RepID=UPI0021E84435|nr:protein SOB FIVE-LIKE 5-like [Andrographis paniculata]